MISRPVFNDDFHHELRRDREEGKGRGGLVRPMAQRGLMLIITFVMMMMIAKHRCLNNSTIVVLEFASKTNQYFNISI